MPKKDKKNKKKRKEMVVRTKEERKKEVMTIIKQLNDFELNATYEPVKKLYALIKQYIDMGEKLKINIPFPMINRRIKGLLATSVKEEVWIKLENEKF